MVHIIQHQHLQKSKMLVEWIPKHLILHHEKQQIVISLHYLIHYGEDPTFLKSIVVGNESWCHRYPPESYKMSKYWRRMSSPQK
ncbi:hypothetical protein TNCT_349351 [Trichonephila clavata]|uniref:Uncharacterized protein n=1 Tax=Trichonephila clavata TaxID=2740835 RepID=A0A8X6FY96_TRICU|nr:hypothetical protein TNCT_349351 [Trichonephila clavata]